MLRHLNYIAVEGPIGVGKTSLTLKLAEYYDGKALLEEVNQNPFLENFYQDRPHSAFPTQVFFLLNRYRQQQQLKEKDLFSSLYFTDYMFFRDRLFAYMNLTDEELTLYEELYAMLSKNLIKPNLILYLDASVSTLMKRIRKRGREVERYLKEEYIEATKNSLHYFFFHYDEAPVLIVNTDNADFINNEEQFEQLIIQLEAHKGGKGYYNPAG